MQLLDVVPGGSDFTPGLKDQRIPATLIRLLVISIWPKKQKNGKSTRRDPVFEARDLNHAIHLISKHPGIKSGPFEICSAADLNEMIRESGQRRKATAR